MNLSKVKRAAPVVMAFLVALVGLACGNGTPSTWNSEATPVPVNVLPPQDKCPEFGPGVSCSARDVSAITMFHPQVGGALFDYEIPDTERVLELGYLGAGRSPAHIVILGTPAANSARCNWRDTVMTNGQREEALRFLLELSDDQDLPSTVNLQTTVDYYVGQMHAHYRDAMQASFNHLVNGGVMTDGQNLVCYVDYAVSEYLLGSGPSSVTVAYDELAKTRSYTMYQRAHAAGFYGTDALMTKTQHKAANDALVTAAKARITNSVAGRTSVVFLAPFGAHSTIAIEAWQAVAQWDVQIVNSVKHVVRYGAPAHYRELSQTLAAFKTKITSASASDAHAGKRIGNISGLPIYYRDIGAYGNIAPADAAPIIFTPAQPPPFGNTAVQPPTTVPPVPTAVAAVATRNGAWLTWNAPADPTVTGYRILRRITGIDEAFTILVNDTGNTTTAFHDTQNVQLGRNHIYHILALNEQGVSARSARLATVIQLPQVANLTASATSTNVTLSWDLEGWTNLDKTTVTGFRVMRRRDGTPTFTKMADIGKTDRVHVDWYTISAGLHIYRIETIAGAIDDPGPRVEVTVPGHDPNNPGPRKGASAMGLRYSAVVGRGTQFYWPGQSATAGKTTTGYTMQASTTFHGPWHNAVPWDLPGRYCKANMSVSSGDTEYCYFVYDPEPFGWTDGQVRYFRLIAHAGNDVSETGPVTAVQLGTAGGG